MLFSLFSALCNFAGAEKIARRVGNSFVSPDGEVEDNEQGYTKKVKVSPF